MAVSSLSSRRSGGRFFNVFRYTDTAKAKGVWGQPADTRFAPGGIKNESGACNGEILIVPCHRADGKRPPHWPSKVCPAGPGRSNVTIYWKELVAAADY